MCRVGVDGIGIHQAKQLFRRLNRHLQGLSSTIQVSSEQHLEAWMRHEIIYLFEKTTHVIPCWRNAFIILHSKITQTGHVDILRPFSLHCNVPTAMRPDSFSLLSKSWQIVSHLQANASPRLHALAKAPDSTCALWTASLWLFLDTPIRWRNQSSANYDVARILSLLAHSPVSQILATVLLKAFLETKVPLQAIQRVMLNVLYFAANYSAIEATISHAKSTTCGTGFRKSAAMNGKHLTCLAPTSFGCCCSTSWSNAAASMVSAFLASRSAFRYVAQGANKTHGCGWTTGRHRNSHKSFKMLQLSPTIQDSRFSDVTVLSSVSPGAWLHRLPRPHRCSCVRGGSSVPPLQALRASAVRSQGWTRPGSYGGKIANSNGDRIDRHGGMIPQMFITGQYPSNHRVQLALL